MESKDKIKEKVIAGAKKYKNNLLPKNILFIFLNNKKTKFIETKFYDFNYLHLTGLKYKGTAKEFFSACIDNKLSVKDFEIINPGFTRMKLDIMNNILDIHKSAKMIGNYNYSRQQLTVEKVVGNIRCCMGFSLDNNTKCFYSPKSILKDNINTLTDKTYRIIGILSKDVKKELYSEITYLSNDVMIDELFKNEDIGNLIDIEKLYSENKTYQNKINIFNEELEELRRNSDEEDENPDR